jgi:hypothetical protein
MLKLDQCLGTRQAAAALTIFSNAMFGLSIVYYNAVLNLLALLVQKYEN